MKKICFITTLSTTLKAFVLETAQYLYENGEYDISFICDNDEEFSKTLPDYINYIPITIKRGINITGIYSVIKLLFIFKKEKFDLVQYSTPNASFYASIAGKLAGVPVRLYCQWGIVYVGFSGVKRKIFKTIEKIVCSFSTWIEPDSFGNLKFCREEGLYSVQKSSVIWNGSARGVNLKKFDIKYKNDWRLEIRSKYNICDDIFVIGFVGRITRDKGVNELYSACKMFFREYPNSRLMLIGNNEKAKTIDDELYQWSIKEQRIIYCGITTEVEKHLSAMDIFVLPSYREGFGSVVIEAEAMGIPVVVTDIQGPTDAMVKDETGLIVKKADTESLVIAMRLLMNDSAKREKMGIRGHAFVKSNFETSQLMKHILHDRNELLKDPI